MKLTRTYYAFIFLAIILVLIAIGYADLLPR